MLVKDEANQWWQWLRRTFKEEGKEITWDLFVEEFSDIVGILLVSCPPMFV